MVRNTGTGRSLTDQLISPLTPSHYSHAEADQGQPCPPAVGSFAHSCTTVLYIPFVNESLYSKYRVYVQGPRRGNDFSATGPAGLIKVWVSSGEGDINQPSGNWPLANL